RSFLPVPPGYIVLQANKNLEEYLKTPPSDPLPEPTYVPEKQIVQPKDKLPGKRQEKRDASKASGTRPPGMPVPPSEKDEPAAGSKMAPGKGSNNGSLDKSAEKGKAQPPKRP
ncbi:MAG TPA: hypothetical protein VK183_00030, partial [Flavobacterium sp.]|nr:hypothetical protein [Flavobacterium sp.]